ncbi:MAG: hypothetical protein ACOCQ5_01830 [Halanaerobiales bacterium]
MVDFNFSLDKVLKVREIRENQAQNKFLQAKKEQKQIKNKLEQTAESQKKLYNFVRKNDLNLEESIQARNYLFSNRKRINNMEKQLYEQKKEVEKKQKNMLKKTKKRQVLEELKQKEYSKFYRNLLFKEQKQIDELTQRMESRVEL